MDKYLMPFLSLTLEMAPWLLLGFLFAGLLHAFVPRRVFGKYLAAGNMRSVITAAAIGVPLPLCSCGVIPTAMSLRRNGASKGATVSFLISTPQTGVDSILATSSLMGWPMAAIRPIAAFITAIFGGHMVNAFDKSQGSMPTAAEQADEVPSGFLPKIKDALRYGFVDMVQDIGKWLIIGLLIAGVINILVPDDFFAGLKDYPLLSMLAVLLIAVPMYVCATGSIPIAVALMLKGLTPGAALVFLMAGPTTNMAAIMVIGKVLERRSLLIYLASIVIGAMAFGIIIDTMLPASWFMPTVAHDCCASLHSWPLWKILSAVVLAILLIMAFSLKHTHNHHKETNMSTTAKRYIVTGMECNHCKANVEKALAAIDGVEAFEVNLADGIAQVSGSADSAQVCSVIESLGYGCKVQA